MKREVAISILLLFLSLIFISSCSFNNNNDYDKIDSDIDIFCLNCEQFYFDYILISNEEIVSQKPLDSADILLSKNDDFKLWKKIFECSEKQLNNSQIEISYKQLKNLFETNVKSFLPDYDVENFNIFCESSNFCLSKIKNDDELFNLSNWYFDVNFYDGDYAVPESVSIFFNYNFLSYNILRIFSQLNKKDDVKNLCNDLLVDTCTYNYYTGDDDYIRKGFDDFCDMFNGKNCDNLRIKEISMVHNCKAIKYHPEIRDFIVEKICSDN